MSTNHFMPEVIVTAEQSQIARGLRPLAVQKDASPASRDALVTENLSLVSMVMHRISPKLSSSIEAEDVMSAGVMGLVDAAQKFDSSRAIQFRTYAQFRVRGAMLDYLRSLTWAPRAMYGRARKLNRTRSDIENRSGRNATTLELAEGMGLSIEEQHSLMLDIERLRFCDSETLYEDRALTRAALSADTTSDIQFEIERKELIAILGQIMNCLPERQRLVLWLYYFEGLTMKEVGQVLKVKEARVSQLHSKAITTLRRYMTGILDGEVSQEDLSRTNPGEGLMANRHAGL
jgi:RNA polymerase sigma factor for flagellar operon FliA